MQFSLCFIGQTLVGFEACARAQSHGQERVRRRGRRTEPNLRITS
jgi:hypothetical protein